ncbi:hypothetical protein KIW84_022469 [Lathyrus oleraceus]|uniref:Uncharacterized protein n=1 Tax=Pisum sativum TaxID=3888 RepID=A0A9D4YCK9_PEA|nr:hypothetical protein KIW84_022469 [Pisum sativum]
MTISPSKLDNNIVRTRSNGAIFSDFVGKMYSFGFHRKDDSLVTASTVGTLLENRCGIHHSMITAVHGASKGINREFVSIRMSPINDSFRPGLCRSNGRGSYKADLFTLIRQGSLRHCSRGR